MDLDEELNVSSELQWTPADQAMVDTFTAGIIATAKMWKGHPDVIIVGFTQTLGSLMRRNLQLDAGRLAQYQHWIDMLRTHVEHSVPAQKPIRES